MVILSALRASCRVRVVLVVLADIWMLPKSIALEVKVWVPVPEAKTILPEAFLVKVVEPDIVRFPFMVIVPVP